MHFRWLKKSAQNQKTEKCVLTHQGNGSALRVFIDYALPEAAPARWLRRLFGGYYAKWCTQQMVDDAVKHFASPT